MINISFCICQKGQLGTIEKEVQERDSLAYLVIFSRLVTVGSLALIWTVLNIYFIVSKIPYSKFLYRPDVQEPWHLACVTAPNASTLCIDSLKCL